MVIAVYAEPVSNKASETYSLFIRKLFQSLTDQFSEHSFFLFENATLSEPVFVNDERVINVFTKPSIFYRYFLQKKLSRELKKIKAEVVLSIDGSLQIKTPQCFLYSKLKSKKKLKAGQVITLSQSLKKSLNDEQKVKAEKIQVVYGGGTEENFIITEEEKEMTKKANTNGKEYFFYRGNIAKSQIIPLLKAFSIFKKRQKSDMKLVLMGKIEENKEELGKLIDTYKYRQDVIVTGYSNQEIEMKMMASAYAYVEPFATTISLFAFDAMNNKVPVIAAQESSLNEIGSDAALFFPYGDVGEMADRLMTIYKDEQLRNRLIEKGQELGNQYNWRRSVEIIEKTLVEVRTD